MDKMNICKICNKEFEKVVSLSNHISRVHKIKIKYYYDQFIKIDNEGKCLFCFNNTSFATLEKGYHRYCSYSCLNRSNLVKEKKRQTSIVHFGVDNPNKSDIIKKKKIDTYQKKFGVNNPSQDLAIQNKKIQTNLIRYGVDNFSKTIQSRMKARNLLITRITNNNGSITPRVGISEKLFFDKLLKLIGNIPVILNQYFMGYYPDCRIEKIKLVIEFDEPEHFTRGWYKARDIRKNQDYESFGYNVYRIKESDWKNKSDSVLTDCVNYINRMNHETKSV